MTILQPVLGWEEGIWLFSSWNCCPTGQAMESAPLVGLSPGEVIYGFIEQVEGGANWTVFSGWAGQSSVLTVPTEGRVFDWVDVTLETYGVSNCSDLSSGPATLFNMDLLLINSDTGVLVNITPAWEIGAISNECNGTIIINSPFSVTIQPYNDYSTPTPSPSTSTLPTTLPSNSPTSASPLPSNSSTSASPLPTGSSNGSNLGLSIEKTAISMATIILVGLITF